MSTQEVKDQVKNKIQLIEEVDSTINAVCKTIKDDSLTIDSYADTVKALAELVVARALL